MRQRWEEFESFRACVDAAFKHCPNVIAWIYNGGFHTAKRLLVPINIILRHLSGGILPPENAVFFQPPHW